MFGKMRRVKSNAFDVKTAKLLTALTLNPAIGVTYDFVTSDNKTKLFIYPVSDMFKCEPSEIDVDGKATTKELQLREALKNVYNYMKQRQMITEDPFMSKVDNILYTSLESAAVRYNIQSNEEQKKLILKSIEDRSLKLNAYRKIVSCGGRDVNPKVEGVVGTTLGTLNYFTNNTSTDNKVAKCGVNERTFFEVLEDIKAINKTVVTGIESHYDLLNFACARTEIADRKAEYLAGLYATRFKNERKFATSDIVVGETKNMLDEVTMHFE